MDRALRRAHRSRIIRRRSSYDHAIFHCHKTPGRYAKTHPLECNCQRKIHGNPKLSRGCCYGNETRRDILNARQLSRELTRISRELDLDSDAVVLRTTNPRTKGW